VAKGKSKSSGINNTDRKCGKAWKKRKRKQRKTGRTIGGYLPSKLRIRELKRQNYVAPVIEVLPDDEL
jgi:hypothetical protein